MLCDLEIGGFRLGENLVETWVVLIVLATVFIGLLSSIPFYLLYQKPNYELWRWKFNPRFPPPEKVKDEIQKSGLGLLVATLPPALCLYLTKHGMTKGYCGFEEEGHGVEAAIRQYLITWAMGDIFHWSYHHFGHSYEAAWKVHSSHHKYHNPTPFAVIADDLIDQGARAFPMLAIPLIMEINLDVFFLLQWGLMFYSYGIFLHCGYEAPLHFLGAHQPIFNTSYHHYLHHSVSTNKRPYFTGFWVQFWDHIFGTTYPGDCLCAVCAQKHGKRSLEEFEKIEKPDYSVLLHPSFWLKTASDQQ